MAFDPLSWAIGFALTRRGGSVLKKSEAKALARSLRDGVVRWSRELPKHVCGPDPDAIVNRLSEANCEPADPKRRGIAVALWEGCAQKGIDGLTSFM